MDGQPHLDGKESFEVMALDPGVPESDGEFQAVFENTLGFPMARRPIDSLRQKERQIPDETIHDWLVSCQVSIGSQLLAQHRKETEQLVWIWRDRFCIRIVCNTQVFHQWHNRPGGHQQSITLEWATIV